MPIHKLVVEAKRLVFHLSPQDGHVIIVSGCLILTAVNLNVLIRMAYITKRLVKLSKIYCDISLDANKQDFMTKIT